MLKDLLEKNNIKYKMQEYSPNSFIFKIENKLNIVEIIEKSSTFSLDRDLFYYLSNQKIQYSFVLENSYDNKVFFIEFKDNNNWLYSSFERSDKEKLFFGKIVLNNESNLDKIIEKIKKILLK